jgi:hypothetical protein
VTWQESYQEACIGEAESALRGLAILVAVLVALVLLVPTTWMALPAGAGGVFVAWRGLVWGTRLARARMGRVRPPYDDWR